MTKEEILEAISEDKTMPFIQPEQLTEIVDFVIKNYKPSLPSNLDEAAEEALDDFDANWYIDELDDGCTEPGYNLKQMLLMFNAGVEWMAGQGEIHETEIVSRINASGLLPAVTCLVDNSYKEGDKVVVQIRKKEEK